MSAFVKSIVRSALHSNRRASKLTPVRVPPNVWAPAPRRTTDERPAEGIHFPCTFTVPSKFRVGPGAVASVTSSTPSWVEALIDTVPVNVTSASVVMVRSPPQAVPDWMVVEPVTERAPGLARVEETVSRPPVAAVPLPWRVRLPPTDRRPVLEIVTVPPSWLAVAVTLQLSAPAIVAVADPPTERLPPTWVSEVRSSWPAIVRVDDPLRTTSPGLGCEASSDPRNWMVSVPRLPSVTPAESLATIRPCPPPTPVPLPSSRTGFVKEIEPLPLTVIV